MIHSFLLIGQSNMAGRGDMGEAPPPSDRRLLLLRNGRWQPLYRPVNNDRAFSGVCLAESFASAYAADRDVFCGLIPCADGGTRLDQWAEGSLLYDHAVYMARLAQRTSTIAGVLWHQGEGDCADAYYPHYEEKLSRIFAALRRDLSLYDVPFLVGGLGDYLPRRTSDPQFRNYTHVNEALRHYAETHPMTGFVCAEGLSCKPDFLHFDTPSLLCFGKRYYQVFLTLEDKNKVFAEKPDMDFSTRSAMESL